VVISCTVTATTTLGAKAALTYSASAPYTFAPKVLNLIFDDIVLGWASKLVLGKSLAFQQSFLAAPYYTVSLKVSDRFIAAMGSELYSAATVAYLALSLDLYAANITTPQVLPSGSAGFSVLFFVVAPLRSFDNQFLPSYTTTVSILTSTSDPLQFKLASGARVPLYLPSDSAPPSVFVPAAALLVLANAELASTLPLTSSQTQAATASLAARLNTASKGAIAVTDILSATFAVRSSCTVLFALIISCGFTDCACISSPIVRIELCARHADPRTRCGPSHI
jgi:hypothetical protein